MLTSGQPIPPVAGPPGPIASLYVVMHPVRTLMMEKLTAKLENPPIRRRSCCAYPRRPSAAASFASLIHCGVYLDARLPIESLVGRRGKGRRPPSVEEEGGFDEVEELRERGAVAADAP